MKKLLVATALLSSSIAYSEPVIQLSDIANSYDSYIKDGALRNARENATRFRQVGLLLKVVLIQIGNRMYKTRPFLTIEETAG